MRDLLQYFRLRTFCLIMFLLLVVSATVGIVVSNFVHASHQQRIVALLRQTSEQASIIDDMRLLAAHRQSRILSILVDRTRPSTETLDESGSEFLQLALKLGSLTDPTSFTSKDLTNRLVRINNLNDLWDKEFVKPALAFRKENQAQPVPVPLIARGQELGDELESELIQFHTAALEGWQELKTAESEQQTSKQWVVAGIATTLLIICGILLITLARFIERPIEILNKSSRMFSGGHRITVPTVKSFQELNELSENLGEMIRSIQEREGQLRESQIATARTNQDLLTIMEYAQFLQQVNDEQEIAVALVKQVRRIITNSSVALYLRHRTRNDYELAVSVPDIADPHCPFLGQLTTESCSVCRNNQPMCVFDGQQELWATCQPEHSKFRSELCLPLSAGGAVLGMLHLGAVQAVNWSADAIKLVGTLANFTAPAISSLRSMEDLRERATRDPLTGLHNRRYLEEVLPILFESARREREPISIVLLDVDNFKYINDREGHDAGDSVLCEIGAVTRGTLRASDIVCRYGGEEFIVILPRTNPAGALILADKLSHAIPMRCHTPISGPVTVSIGIAAYPDHGDRGEEILKGADLAMYAAKARGRNCIVTFNSESRTPKVLSSARTAVKSENR